MNATLMTLLGLILPFTARGGSPISATGFPSVAAFELRTRDFQPGDNITIQQLRGTRPTIRTGEVSKGQSLMHQVRPHPARC
jgi:hypothetical protein